MIIAIMPAHNEEKSIDEIIRRTKKYADKLIVVNDASTDRTAEIAKRSGVILVSHKKNKGLGSSLRTGFREALKITKQDDDIIITIDADGQHNPADIPKFIKKIEQGCGFVLGQRNLINYPIRKRVGNFFLNYMTNVISRTKLNDTESGFRAFTREALAKLNLKADRYEIAVDIISEIGKNRIKSTNVLIESSVYVKGVGVWDGVKNFYFLLKK